MDIRVDKKTARAIQQLLNDLRNTTGIDEQLKLEHFLKFSEIFEIQRESECAEKTWEATKEAVICAIADLKKMRKAEGEALVSDIVMRIKNLEKCLKSIEQISKANLDVTYQKLVHRIQKLLGDEKISEDKLTTEIALIADKMDVTEECVRLQSHNRLFIKSLNEERIVGKKLNFLLQEMNRETNTISAKAAHAEISHLVVEMKGEIEKLREQVQNLE